MKAADNLYIKNIAQLVTCGGSLPKRGKEAMNNLGIVEGPAAVICRDGVVTYAGPMSGVTPADTIGCHELDAGGCCVLPGFVDSHTHLVFGGFREDEFQWRLAGDSYMSIMERGGGIANTMRATREASKEELKEAARGHLQAMLRMGVTTMEAKSGYGMDLQTELKQLEVAKELDAEQPVDIFSTFMGAHDVPPEYKGRAKDFVQYLIQEVMPVVKEKGLAECCDIFVEKGVFHHDEARLLLKAAADMGFSLKMHADEIVPFAGAELAAELGCLSADHLLQISDAGIKALAESKQTIATLLPCTAFSLQADYAPARKMIDAGCAVALASDLNPGSCFSASVPLMIALATIYMNMSVEEAVSALTVNGAAALGKTDIGCIAPGFKADMAVLRYPSYKFLSYHFGMNIVKYTVKRGVVYQNF